MDGLSEHIAVDVSERKQKDMTLYAAAATVNENDLAQLVRDMDAP